MINLYFLIQKKIACRFDTFFFKKKLIDLGICRAIMSHDDSSGKSKLLILTFLFQTILSSSSAAPAQTCPDMTESSILLLGVHPSELDRFSALPFNKTCWNASYDQQRVGRRDFERVRGHIVGDVMNLELLEPMAFFLEEKFTHIFVDYGVMFYLLPKFTFKHWTAILKMLEPEGCLLFDASGIVSVVPEFCYTFKEDQTPPEFQPPSEQLKNKINFQGQHCSPLSFDCVLDVKCEYSDSKECWSKSRDGWEHEKECRSEIDGCIQKFYELIIPQTVRKLFREVFVPEMRPFFEKLGCTIENGPDQFPFPLSSEMKKMLEGENGFFFLVEVRKKPVSRTAE